MAGGTGSRMRSKVPKPFLLHHGVPIIIKTIKKFWEADAQIKIIVVLPNNHLATWFALEESYPFIKKVVTTVGGATRMDSVRSGLNKIEKEGLVAIHDAVRPFVELNTIIESYHSAEVNGSGVAAVKLKDSIREIIDPNTSISKNRSQFVLVQTPQTFTVAKIRNAYRLIADPSFTDDASVFETAGHHVCLVEGSYSNIKITTLEDLK